MTPQEQFAQRIVERGHTLLARKDFHQVYSVICPPTIVVCKKGADRHIGELVYRAQTRTWELWRYRGGVFLGIRPGDSLEAVAACATQEEGYDTKVGWVPV